MLEKENVMATEMLWCKKNKGEMGVEETKVYTNQQKNQNSIKRCVITKHGGKNDWRLRGRKNAVLSSYNEYPKNLNRTGNNY